ncbi:50S ribosomal protein L1 [candidate division WOR-3 bacterium]|nr:50S ribosomal protein L1 [candidate division WOR-3 bacterium]MCK4527917.1 50S ribosomal protein L1 [candidate division WOR-3 bacterium]
MKRSRRYEGLRNQFDKSNRYPIEEAIKEVRKLATAKFDETIELSVNLGVDPRKSDQMVRGSVVLPKGSGKERKVLVFAEGELQVKAEEAGADWVGGEEFVKKIEDGWLECDAVVSVPEMMPKIGKLGRILGPRGLMPTPKDGTVTRDIGAAVEEIKKGKINFKVDKSGNLHIPIGKASFKEEDLYENFSEAIRKIWSLRPPSASGVYIYSIILSSTMGPGVKVDTQQVRNEIIQRR